MPSRLRSILHQAFATALLTTGLVAVSAIAQVPDDVWTGCLSAEDGKVYDVRLGDEPLNPCKKKDTIIRFGSGDISAVLAGDGLLGGGESGAVTLGLDWDALDEAYAGPVPWSRLVDVPPDLADGDQTGSPLAGVECNSGKYVTGFDPDGNAMCSDGQIAEPPPEPWIMIPTLSGFDIGANSTHWSAGLRAWTGDPDTGATQPTHVELFHDDACTGDPVATGEFEYSRYYWGYAYVYSVPWVDVPDGATLTWRGTAVVDGVALASDCSEPQDIWAPVYATLVPNSPYITFDGDVTQVWDPRWELGENSWGVPIDRVDLYLGEDCIGEPYTELARDWRYRDYRLTEAWSTHEPGTTFHAQATSGPVTGGCDGPLTWPAAPDPPLTDPYVTSVSGWWVNGDGWTDGGLEMFFGAECATDQPLHLLDRIQTGTAWTAKISNYSYSVLPVGSGDTISVWARHSVTPGACTSFTIP